MRIITQDGGDNIPYENTVIQILGESIIATHDGKSYCLGKYSSAEKCKAVFEYLYKMGAKKNSSYSATIMPKEEEVK